MGERVEIRENLPNYKGRGLFAKNDIDDGETIFEEDPLVCCQFLWNALYKYAACDHCLRPLEAAEENVRRLSEDGSISLPHPECCSTDKTQHVSCPNAGCAAKYCSASCQSAAQTQYHASLCYDVTDERHPLARLAETWRNIHYPPETASITLITRMIAAVRQSSNPPAAVAAFDRFCHAVRSEREEIAHKLLGAQFEEAISVLRAGVREAVHAPEVHHWLTPDGFTSLLALLGTNSQGIGTSPLSVWVGQVEEQMDEDDALDAFIDNIYVGIEKVSGAFINSEGAGLYSLQSACNHSCRPSAEVTFPHNNSRLALKALRSIAAGEEIHIRYLDECDSLRSRHSRRKILRENYLFDCNCELCEEEADEPDMTSEEEE